MKTRTRFTPVSRLRASRARLVLAALAATSTASAGTVAYYRFDDAHASPSGALTSPIPDASGNAHDLNPIQSPTLSPDVPLATVPATGAANKSSVRIRSDLNQDLYSPGNERLSRVGFTAFTIETWVRFASVGGVQTIIGRDDINEAEGPQALFYLSKSADGRVPPGHTPNGLRVELVTRENRLLAINSAHAVQPGVWYHVAVVGDPAAGTLSLYADGVRIGQTEGFTGLFSPTRHGMWSVGRGQYNGRIADRFDGFVDEIRFSDEALAPDRFLNAAPPPPPAPPVVEPAPAAEPAPAKPKPARRKFWPWWPRR